MDEVIKIDTVDQYNKLFGLEMMVTKIINQKRIV